MIINNKSTKTDLTKDNLADDPPADAKDMIPHDSTWSFRPKTTINWNVNLAYNYINMYINNSFRDFSTDDYIVRSISGYITYIEVIKPLTIWCVIPTQVCFGYLAITGTGSTINFNFNFYIFLIYKQGIYSKNIKIAQGSVSAKDTAEKQFSINIQNPNIKLDLFTGDTFYFQFVIEKVTVEGFTNVKFSVDGSYSYFYNLSSLKYKLNL